MGVVVQCSSWLLLRVLDKNDDEWEDVSLLILDWKVVMRVEKVESMKAKQCEYHEFAALFQVSTRFVSTKQE